MEKKRSSFRSVFLIDPDHKRLSANAKLLKEMNAAQIVSEFTSGKEALEFLILMKRLSHKGTYQFPELLLVDTSFPYFEKRDFLNDLLLLYPEKEKRPNIVLLGNERLYKKHIAAQLILEQPLDEEKIEQILK